MGTSGCEGMIRSDAIVVGSGPAAYAAAIALAEVGLAVVAAHCVRASTNRFGEHLAPEASVALCRLNLDHLITTGSHIESFGIRSKWGRNGVTDKDYLFAPYGSGWNLDRQQFDGSLRRTALERGVRIHHYHQMSITSRRNGLWRLRIRSESKSSDMEAMLLVDATGRNAWLSRKLGAYVRRIDRLIGIYGMGCTHQLSSGDIDTRLYVESMDDGWWYSIIIPGRRFIAVYMTDWDLVSRGRQASLCRWWQRLGESEITVSRVDIEKPLMRFSIGVANSQRISKFFGDGWLAVGDAAMALDPLASTGLSKALFDGLDAANIFSSTQSERQTKLEEYAYVRGDIFEEYLRERNAVYSQSRGISMG